jgi:hypothetical protein
MAKATDKVKVTAKDGGETSPTPTKVGGEAMARKPSKIATLLRYLPEEIRETQKIRLYAGKDTGGVSKILYQWRKKKGLLASSVVSGKLSATTEAKDAFHIGVEDVNKQGG